MNKLPPIPSNFNPDGQQRKLSEWMAEWHADRLLADADNQTPPVSHQPPTGASWPETSPIPGSILLLCPTEPLLSARPRYIAILNIGPDGQLLVAPFSRFSQPAIPGELNLGGEALLTRVLCIWNTRRVATLPPAWTAGMMAESERAKAMTIYANLIEKTPIPLSLKEQTGPALQHPLDPRWAYLDDERQWIELSLAKERIHTQSSYEQISAPTPLPKAAESRAEYRTSNDNAKPE
ncbi:MAG TPA: hypothetical protein DCZ95_11195 [Verrucomicrobia bacterium]|nr:MAG: hypothetical protein A2X46_07790 [Lentisphaerae bacterium GWF2_57_35]HBA84650.1 hypothetical protein [Verrucomicrobiota bacterium]